MLNKATILQRYLAIWRHHDVDALTTLFTNDACYRIEDKRILRGITEIKEYWIRNSIRQRELTVFPLVGPLDKYPNGPFAFGAEFYDSEMGKRQLVHGLIDIEVKNDRIVTLSERYAVLAE